MNQNLPQDVKLKLPGATHLEIQHDIYGKDSSVYVVSKKNDLIEKTDINDVDNDDILTKVEQMPSFTGGEKAMKKYFAENLHYHEDARKNHIRGTVFILFVIEKDGSVSHVKIAQGIEDSCDNEAMRAIKNMPTWITGQQSGKFARVRFNMPVSFPL